MLGHLNVFISVYLPYCGIQGNSFNIFGILPKISKGYGTVYGVSNYSMLCCALRCVHSSFAIILMGKGEVFALLFWSSWCLVIVVWLFLKMPRVFLHFVNVVFPGHTHYVLGSWDIGTPRLLARF